MTDVHSKSVRSYNMSRIRSKNTKPELLVRKFLHAAGFRYRIHAKNLPGKPDMVLPKYKTVVFVHGCFWHRHEGCKYNVVPKTNQDYWEPKRQRNAENDIKNKIELCKNGWVVLTVWECQLKKHRIDNTLRNLVSRLTNTLEFASS